jgi:hypothetical protein
MDRKKVEELLAEKAKIEREEMGSPLAFERLNKLPDREKEVHLQVRLDPHTFERWKLLAMVLSDEVHV